MGIVYPAGIDSFSIPANPQTTTLSSGGSSTRDHPQSHQDLGAAVVALETNAAQISHDHSGSLASIGVAESTTGSTATDDVQTVAFTGTPTAGTFTLTLGDDGSTAAISYDAAGADVQTALEGIVGAGNVTVAGATGGPFTVVFGGTYGEGPQPTMTATPDLTGGSVTVIHTVIGSAGGGAVQTVTISGGPTGGTFILGFNGQVTPALAYDASASTVQAALAALSSVGANNVAVTGGSTAPYVVTFQGALGNSPQPLIVATSDLTGGMFATQQLAQVNTHQDVDTDLAITSIHHTVGTGPTQAAAGNHAHDYNGASIFNKPMAICTSTTRPIDPVVGMLIFEQDTNCARVWSEFSGNTLGVGVNYTYAFNSANTPSQLNPSLFTQLVVQGTTPADGMMGAPSAGDCIWQRGANATCQIVYQAAMASAATTNTDDQIITFTTGKNIIQTAQGYGSPSNDAYLRMSADGQTYVRFSVQESGVGIYFSSAGEVAEQGLGGTKTPYSTANTTWVAKAIGDTYVLYRNGVQVLAVVDYNNLVQIGEDFRGWAIGMVATQGTSAQRLPNDVTSVQIQDNVYHVEALDWQLLNWAAVPHIRVEARFAQTVVRGPKGNVIGYDTVISDWTIDPFTNLDVDGSAFTVTEAGHYNVHLSIPWDPAYHGFDQSALGISVNGQDVGRKTVTYMLGNSVAPGFPQTNELFFTYYFAQGDVVRVWAQHNAAVDQWLYHNSIPPQVFVAWAEFDFTGP